MVQEMFRKATTEDVYKIIRSFLAGYIKANGVLEKGAKVPVNMKKAVYLKYLPPSTEDIVVDIPSSKVKKSKQYCFRLFDCNEKNITAIFKMRKMELY